MVLSDPEEIKQVFTAPPEVLHPGEGARILEPVIGANSVILLDEAPHLRQRKLLLPAFHGEKMQRLSGLMSELTEREVASWPSGEPTALHPRLQRLTLEVMLRTVFGLQRGAQLDELRDLTTEILAFGESPLSLIPPAQRLLAGRGPVGRMERVGARADELIYELIEERRAAGDDGDDVLSMLLDARDEDGEPMSPAELRDELVTALVAGHETTASQLAWALERIAREPQRAARLHDELDGGPTDDAYLTATINEILRRRPVVPQRRAAPGQAADRDRRNRVPARRRAVRQRLPRAPRPGDLPRPLRVPPRALPRAGAGDLHVDSLRRRTPALSRRELRAAGDEDRAACGARSLRAALSGRPARGRRAGAASPSAPPAAAA